MFVLSSSSQYRAPGALRPAISGDERGEWVGELPGITSSHLYLHQYRGPNRQTPLDTVKRVEPHP